MNQIFPDQSRLVGLNEQIAKMQVTVFLDSKGICKLIETCRFYSQQFPPVNVRQRIHILNLCQIQCTASETLENVVKLMENNKDHIASFFSKFVQSGQFSCSRILISSIEAISRVQCIQKTIAEDDIDLFNTLLSKGSLDPSDAGSLVIHAAKHGRLTMILRLKSNNHSISEKDFELAYQEAEAKGFTEILQLIESSFKLL